MANTFKATGLVFDATMSRILLNKGPKYHPMSVEMSSFIRPINALQMLMENAICIQTEFQPQWWLMRSEHVQYSSDSSVTNHIFFGLLTNNEFESVTNKNQKVISAIVHVLTGTKKVHDQLKYWIPMAKFLYEIPKHLWPKP